MVARCTIYCTFFILAGLCHLAASDEDPASSQLLRYAENHPEQLPLTTDGGNPLDSVVSVPSIGAYGPLVMDRTFFEMVARVVREATPPRPAHAKGSGAFGYFEVTHDITKYTKAKLFEKVGKKTPVAVRFSMAVGEFGTAETVRDTRGMATKFYTEEGIWDLLASNVPVFPFRDPMFIVHLAHTLKRNRRTNLRDNYAVWDLLTLRPESIHTMLLFLSDRAIPDGYRHMDAFGINTYMMINHKNEIFYIKFILKPDQGIRTLSPEEAFNLTAVDPDYFTRDLYNALEKGEYPSWTLYIQVMKPEDVAKYPWSPFDPTKVWFQKDYPRIPVGKIVLNQNPMNYFAEVEQLAYSPGNFVPGIGPSMDKVLQGRIFAYSDSHRYRLGPNHLQIPVNYPKQGMEVSNYNRDCDMAYFNQLDAPNYYPNSFHGPEPVLSAGLPEYNVSGILKRWDLGDDDNYSQPRIFWNKVLKPDQQERIIENIVAIAKTFNRPMKIRMVKYFQPLHEQLGQKLVQRLEVDPEVLKPKQTEC